jgi:hypothetical protein
MCSSDHAAETTVKGDPVVLVRVERSPEDIEPAGSRLTIS